jgi:hypothetical protein
MSTFHGKQLHLTRTSNHIRRYFFISMTLARKRSRVSFVPCEAPLYLTSKPNGYETPCNVRPSAPTPSLHGSEGIHSRENNGHLLESAIIRSELSGRDLCLVYGVHFSIVEANSSNARSIRFDRNIGTICGFADAGGTQKHDWAGSPSDYRTSLKVRGCDVDRISYKWLRNHSRWINWKLCSIERRFCCFLANRYFNYSRVVSH